MKKITLLALLATGVYMNAAHASDEKVYNGSACVPFEGVAGIRLSYSNINNASTTTNLRVDCIAVHDVTSSIGSAWVEVKDPSSTEDVTCTLFAYFNNIGSTGGGFWSQTKSTSGFSDSWKKLTYTGLASNSTSHYYFSCNLPKKSSNGAAYIGSYSITEL